MNDGFPICISCLEKQQHDKYVFLKCDIWIKAIHSGVERMVKLPV